MKLGIFGGSFDPVHFGHLYLAHDAIAEAGLDKVIFVPVRTQPFKQDHRAVSGSDRINMLKEGFKAMPDPEHYDISEFELESETVSYTYITLKHFKELYPDAEIYFIIGEDSVMTLGHWRHAEELLSNYSFIVGMRPGYDDTKMQGCIRDMTKQYGTTFVCVQNRLFDISSTYIREKVYDTDLPDNLVPEGVERYIEQNGLYR